MIKESLKLEIVKRLKIIVNELVKNNISGIVNSNLSEISEEEIKEELGFYPGIMTTPPDQAYVRWDDGIDIYKVQYNPPPHYEGTFRLYFDGEESDLTLKFNVYIEKNEKVLVKLRDLDVM